MQYSLGDHEPVDPVGGQILHVSVQEARSLALQHSVAIANYGSDRRSSSLDSGFAGTRRQGSEVRIASHSKLSHADLIWCGKLAYRDSILIRVASPGPVHQAVRFVLLVF